MNESFISQNKNISYFKFYTFKNILYILCNCKPNKYILSKKILK